MSNEEPMTLEAQQAASRRSAWFWGSFVVVLLTLQVGIGVVAIVLATNDDSVAIVPDYYEKALQWDEQMAAEQASNDLGWLHQVLVPDAMAGDSLRPVVVRLVDAEGQPVTDVQGRLRLYHHARAAEVQELELESLGGGSFRAQARLDRPGLWEVELDMRGGAGERFISSDTVQVGEAVTGSDTATCDGAAINRQPRGEV